MPMTDSMIAWRKISQITQKDKKKGENAIKKETCWTREMHKKKLDKLEFHQENNNKIEMYERATPKIWIFGKQSSTEGIAKLLF